MCWDLRHLFLCCETNVDELRRKVRGRTHVVLVFRHGCNGVFMGTKLHICLSSGLAVKSHINVDPHGIQRREELHTHTHTQERENGGVISIVTTEWSQSLTSSLLCLISSLKAAVIQRQSFIELKNKTTQKLFSIEIYKMLAVRSKSGLKTFTSWRLFWN